MSHQSQHSFHAAPHHAPAVHHAPVVHHAPAVHHAPVVHHAPAVHHAPVVHHAPAVVVKEAPAPAQNIAELVVASPQFSTLLAAVQAADLVDTLAGEGPFTVFAPTNSAFDKVSVILVQNFISRGHICFIKYFKCIDNLLYFETHWQ